MVHLRKEQFTGPQGLRASWTSERTAAGLFGFSAIEGGTGKTMAAGVIANRTGLENYRMDLSNVVSKYIGETEKNSDGAFVQARPPHGTR